MSEPMTDGTPSAKDLNRTQFGANAANYATSVVHAKGASLARLVEVTKPQPTWDALDIATAAGHTAMAFAPHVASVTATDLTPEMVALCAERAIELGHDNVTTQLADAELLPFEDDTFDLVTCRIAPHHFPHQAKFITEAARVLRPGGVFAMVDNIVPDDVMVAQFCDDWERRRDPSHGNCLSLKAWCQLCEAAGLTVTNAETAPKRMQFQTWADNMNVPASVRIELLAELLAVEPITRDFLRPQGESEDDAVFTLTEGLVIAIND